MSLLQTPPGPGTKPTQATSGGPDVTDIDGGARRHWERYVHRKVEPGAQRERDGERGERRHDRNDGNRGG